MSKHWEVRQGQPEDIGAFVYQDGQEIFACGDEDYGEALKFAKQIVSHHNHVVDQLQAQLREAQERLERAEAVVSAVYNCQHFLTTVVYKGLEGRDTAQLFRITEAMKAYEKAGGRKPEEQPSASEQGQREDVK